MSLRVHAGQGDPSTGPSLSYFERRGGETALTHVNHSRARQLADATIPYQAGAFERAMHYHPVTMSEMNAEHIESMTNADTEHQRRMESLGVEHEIKMAHIMSEAKNRVPILESHRLREWNLSAIDGIQAQQHQEAVQRAEDALASRKQEALGDLQKRAAAQALKTKEDHVKNMKNIEREHRIKMMELDEEQLALQNEDTARHVREEHQWELKSMQEKHERKMQMFKVQHAAKMARITKPEPGKPAWEAAEPAPPREFGVVTAEYLWSLGMADEYVQETNLAKKLETALACVSAERPSDPCARLAQLLQ